MKQIIIGVFSLIFIVGKVTGELDFSKFYLPPCCYISPEDNFSGYATPTNKNNLNSKRETSENSKANAKLTNVPERYNVSANEIPQSDPTKPFRAHRKYFKLEVPLSAAASDLVPTTRKPIVTQLVPPTLGKILLQENQSFKSSSDYQQALLKSKLLETIFTLELDKMEKNESVIGRKSLGGKYFREHELQLDHQREKTSTSESQIIETYQKWEPRKLEKNNDMKQLIQKINETASRMLTNSSILEKSSSETIKRQVPRKMPSSWVKHLKRALYQSITASSTEDDTTSGRTTNIKDNPSIKFSPVWDLLKTAELQFVDTMSQSIDNDINRAIYLPQGEGPVVSGVVINSNDGLMKLRVSSELYLHDAIQNRQDNCHCHLLNPGEILVAYWSISRIYNDNGQPALQYLVYPLPHSVPTTPQLLPFANNDPHPHLFSPSPIDPLTRYYENIHRTNAFVESPQSQHPQPQPPNYSVNPGYGYHKPKQNFLENNPNFNQDHYNHKNVQNSDREYHYNNNKIPVQGVSNKHMYRNPKLVEHQYPLSNPYETYNTPTAEAQHENIHPSDPSIVQDERNNVNNVNIPQYSPEFITRYNQDLQNYFLNQQMVQHQGGGGTISIPFTDLNVNGPMNYEFPYPNPTMGPPQPSPHQEIMLGPNNFQLQQQMIQKPPQILIPNNPTIYTPHNDQNQFQKPPTTFPKSIQDIISPVPQNEQELLPSPKPHIQSPPPVQFQQQIPIIPPTGSPSPYFYNPSEGLQEYINHNMIQNLIQLQYQNQGQGGHPYQQQISPNLHSQLQEQKLEHAQKNNSQNNNTELENQEDEQNRNPPSPSQSYVISNVRDNEKKYYPVMSSWKSRNRPFRENYSRSRSRRLQEYNKLAYDIRNKAGYILDF